VGKAEEEDIVVKSEKEATAMMVIFVTKKEGFSCGDGF
jgi:hypothetical protein